VATGALFRLPIGRTSERLAGNLWITEEAEREDTIIAYGQSFVLDRRVCRWSLRSAVMRW
jgi:hypothetical protein